VGTRVLEMLQIAMPHFTQTWHNRELSESDIALYIRTLVFIHSSAPVRPPQPTLPSDTEAQIDNHLLTVMFPDTTKYLRLPADLTFVPNEPAQLQLKKWVCDRKVHICHKAVPASLAIAAGVARLGDVVKEEITSEHSSLSHDTSAGTMPCGADIEKCLRSIMLRRALWRMSSQGLSWDRFSFLSGVCVRQSRSFQRRLVHVISMEEVSRLRETVPCKLHVDAKPACFFVGCIDDEEELILEICDQLRARFGGYSPSPFAQLPLVMKLIMAGKSCTPLLDRVPSVTMYSPKDHLGESLDEWEVHNTTQNFSQTAGTVVAVNLRVASHVKPKHNEHCGYCFAEIVNGAVAVDERSPEPSIRVRAPMIETVPVSSLSGLCAPIPAQHQSSITVVPPALSVLPQKPHARRKGKKNRK